MLRFGLSATLLLAATCLLFRAAFSRRSVERVVTCDDPDHVHRLSCESGVISVRSALYGRADSMTCSEGKPQEQLRHTDCAHMDALDITQQRCDGKKVCELNTNAFSSYDPCSGTNKYLETTYECIPAVHSVTCEHSSANLYCENEQVIFVYNADYGRHDQTTCIYQRPAEQIQNIDCWNPTTKVAESCNGKSSCMVEATESMFGDPCPGTYKYLEVTYTCDG